MSIPLHYLQCIRKFFYLLDQRREAWQQFYGFFRRKSSPMHCLHKTHIRRKSQKHSVIACSYYPVLVLSCPIFYLLSPTFQAHNCCSNQLWTGVTGQHFASALPGMPHCLPLVFCACFLGKGQVLSQLFWGMHKPKDARELTPHKARFDPWESGNRWVNSLFHYLADSSSWLLRGSQWQCIPGAYNGE